MLQLDVTARERSTSGKGPARTLRAAGRTPAVVYGAKVESTALDLDTKSFTKALLGTKRANVVINLNIEGATKNSKRHVMLKEVQSDPITDTLVHADFCEVSLDEPMILKVPVVYTGKAKGVDLGGDLMVYKHIVAVKGKVLDIPDTIEINISDLAIGDRLICKDLAIADNLSLVEDLEMPCIAVLDPSKKAAADAAESAEGAAAAKPKAKA